MYNVGMLCNYTYHANVSITCINNQSCTLMFSYCAKRLFPSFIYFNILDLDRVRVDL